MPRKVREKPTKKKATLGKQRKDLNKKLDKYVQGGRARDALNEKIGRIYNSPANKSSSGGKKEGVIEIRARLKRQAAQSTDNHQ